MINGLKQSKAHEKHVSCECRFELHERKYNWKQELNNGKCQYKRKKPIKYRICEEDYYWNPVICAS